MNGLLWISQYTCIQFTNFQTYACTGWAAYRSALRVCIVLTRSVTCRASRPCRDACANCQVPGNSTRPSTCASRAQEWYCLDGLPPPPRAAKQQRNERKEVAKRPPPLPARPRLRRF